MSVVYCMILCVLYVAVLSGQGWGWEWGGLVSMKPIGAGRIGGLVVRERGLVRIKPLGNRSLCACVCVCVLRKIIVEWKLKQTWSRTFLF